MPRMADSGDEQELREIDEALVQVQTRLERRRAELVAEG